MICGVIKTKIADFMFIMVMTLFLNAFGVATNDYVGNHHLKFKFNKKEKEPGES